MGFTSYCRYNLLWGFNLMWMWYGIKIPMRWCFKMGKKCTPDCSKYNLKWLYY